MDSIGALCRRLLCRLDCANYRHSLHAAVAAAPAGEENCATHEGGDCECWPRALGPAAQTLRLRHDGRRAARKLDDGCKDGPDQILVESQADAQQCRQRGECGEHAERLEATGLPDLNLRGRAADRQLVGVEYDRLSVRDQILAAEREGEGIGLDDEDNSELGRERAQTEKAAAGAEELHVREGKLVNCGHLQATDRVGP
mmetsp:Transcript_42205/g.84707  ORF Transcript_42205/g.84707 Transcript_42205/m.84707 type:complete len:200 (+) Transcript_42205:190-789(+)